MAEKFEIKKMPRAKLVKKEDDWEDRTVSKEPNMKYWW